MSFVPSTALLVCTVTPGSAGPAMGLLLAGLLAAAALALVLGAARGGRAA